MAGNALPTGLSPTYWRTWTPSADLSVPESLEDGEAWIGSWDHVGLYEGNNKVPGYQELIVHLTTHRLLLLPSNDTPSSSRQPRTQALQTSMSYVRQTEFYVGFIRSSPKITLSLGLVVPSPEPASPGSSTNPINASTSTSSSGSAMHGVVTERDTSWTCPVCGYVNPLTDLQAKPRTGDKCGLCGITHGQSSAMGPNGRATPTPTSIPPSSIPPSRTSTPTLTPTAAPAPTPTPAPEAAGARADGMVSCPACTFLNHPSLRNCELCSTPLPRKQNSASAPSPVLSPGTGADTPGGKMDIIRLSFRKGGVQECYRRLKNVLSDKVWEKVGLEVSSSRAQNNGANGGDATPRGVGIDGIMQSMTLDAKVKDERMQDAFKDLEVLMVRAGEMVRLAQSLSAKLPPTPQNSEEETLIRTSLVQLGLPSPALTQDMVRDDQLYLEGLAKELAGILVGRAGRAAGGGGGGGLMVGSEGARGVVSLDEVWVIWMRARGVALLPPSTLISVLPFLPKHTNPPINLLTLPSTLKVLHTPHYSSQAFLTRILHLLAPSPSPASPREGEDNADAREGPEKSLSTIDIASHENLAIGMTKELLDSVEMAHRAPGQVGIVRDEQVEGGGGGVRWYRDLMSEWALEV